MNKEVILKNLRSVMASHKAYAYIITGSDEHNVNPIISILLHLLTRVTQIYSERNSYRRVQFFFAAIYK